MSFLPGRLLAKGTILDQDGKSTINFYVSAQWRETGVLPGAQFSIFTAGDGYPHIGFTGKITGIKYFETNIREFYGLTTVDGQLFKTVFRFPVFTSFYQTRIAIQIQGPTNLSTDRYPDFVLISNGGIVIQDPI